ncbi:MAG TPA: hypothetical protein VN886_01540 [Acidimicrobiales bacterium]|nr:hypothetical protein [Acidimicrobiales bacterium]
MSPVIDQLGRRARGVGATVLSLCGRRGTVATLLTGSRDCLTNVLGVLRSGPHPVRSGRYEHPDDGSRSGDRSSAAPQRRGGGAIYDAPVTASVEEIPVTPSVEEIAGMTDPVLRNLHITQRYHELASDLRDAGVGEDATWCAFAVWASKTAGATIRGEVLPARVKQLLVENEATQDVLHRFNHGVGAWAAEHLVHDHLARAVDEVTADVARSIADGNVLVFSELAPLFTELLEANRQTHAATSEALSAALARAGTDVDGTAVVQAFSAYGQALGQPDERAVLVLQANTLAVSHEQQRLQPAISSALDAAISDTLKRVIDNDVVGHVPTPEARRALDGLTGQICEVLDAAWDTALTETIMQLVTASETLDLRRDVPPLPDGMFPPALRDLPGAAAAVVAEWDKTGGTGAPSGARDWAKLEERMNYIVNLFRSRQRDPSLFTPPFSDAQLAVLATGSLPPGPL